MDLQLRGRAAFVAAASRGMGRAVAEALAAEGCDVGICARDGAALDAARAAVEQRGVRCVASVADLTRCDEINAAIAATVQNLGRLDILVVNAGGPPAGTFDSLDDDAWAKGWELTLMSAVHLIRAALPHLRESDAASITIIASTSVKQPIAGLLLSNAHRGAVSGLAKTLSDELAPQIRVNQLLPGRIRTGRAEELIRNRIGPDGDLDAELARNAEEIPLRRYGDPAEFARAAVFLASPAASYVTGATLPVDGGIIRSTY